jgi:hypothetical protein
VGRSHEADKLEPSRHDFSWRVQKRGILGVNAAENASKTAATVLGHRVTAVICD